MKKLFRYLIPLLAFVTPVMAVNQMGDFEEDATVIVFERLTTAAGAPSDFSDALEADDVKIYKGSSTTEKTSTNGITVDSSFDSGDRGVGILMISIDTSNDTGDAGFWVADAEYVVIVDPDTEQLDSTTITAPVAQFSITNRSQPSVTGAVDWTTAEKEQIRSRLAMDGTQTDPTTNTGTIESILEDTNELQTDDVPALIAGITGERDDPAKNVAYSFDIVMFSSSTGDPTSGLSVVGQRAIEGGAFAAMTGTISEIGSGFYTVNASAADMNGDRISWRFTATGANPRSVTIYTQP